MQPNNFQNMRLFFMKTFDQKVFSFRVRKQHVGNKIFD